MLETTTTLLKAAQAGGYAIGAFNVYNQEGVLGVVAAAEAQRSPVILQVHPPALHYAGPGLLSLCLEHARSASVPVSVHLDHSMREADVRLALRVGVRSVMADGSHLDFSANVNFCQRISTAIKAHGGSLEVELGRLAGYEDGLSVQERDARLTDPAEAAFFVDSVSADFLAVCVGNVHGAYAHAPQLDFKRLAAIRSKVEVPLVLHGASGLPSDQIRQAIDLGICKFNVNTELRMALLRSYRKPGSDLINVLERGVEAVKEVAEEKIRIFGSGGQ